MKKNHNSFLNLAFNLAKINLGKTNENPSVGCIVVKNNTVISSGYTSLKGRPHAESNALGFKKNFINSDLYVTLEPCTHKGKTPPCVNLIKKKGVKRVFYAFNDKDLRTSKKAKNFLIQSKIFSKKIINKTNSSFYNSYFNFHLNKIPFINAKIALSNDLYTINSNSKWITNELSRSRVHLIRSEHDSIISTSKTINKDNALLNCRIDGLNNHTPHLIIIDLKLKLKKNLNIFKKKLQRKIFIVTSQANKKKIIFFKKKGVKFIFIPKLKSRDDFISLLKILKKKNLNRILIECGLIFLKSCIEYKLISNLYYFKSGKNLGKNGSNNISINFLRKLSLKRKINVNLDGDELYMVKLK